MQTTTIRTLPTSGASVKNLPVNLFGAVMGIAGLALAWRGAAHLFGSSSRIADGIGVLALLVFAVLTVAYLLKWAVFPDAVKAEFTHPVGGNFFGTVTIAILLLSGVVAPWNATLQHLAWTAGALSTLVLAYVVVSRVLKGNVAAANVVPAWLIPGVASLDIAVTGGAWSHEVNMLALGIGTAIAVVFYVLIFSRLVHGEPLPAGMVPSLMVMIAPFEVGFLAYANVTQHIDMFAAMLFYFGLFMFLVLAPRVFRRSVPFAPSWWAISFPIAALVNAALKYAAVADSAAVTLLAAALLAFLTVAIAVLLLRTLYSLYNGKLLAG
ncbi:C4-dicarboxylate ABC transporter [Pseudoduganella eburnea]|uniref:C4-dicarboxylate ABC transporter n=1 Tax=Massilia eburnea TaxID=1776165 RepID=A0A6L6QG02_9BURK|nr:SLAC1 anion channel family protein [Massilia eburnea]MTW10583.1 C4-dicarboxylate ABC transporter [Massilia eburnea]